MVFVIAEVGINHNGNLDFAKKLIKMAKDCGCDAVKFQKRNVRKVIPKAMWDVLKETPDGIVPYIDYKESLEFGKASYDEIYRYCKKLKIDWFASAWDLDSQKFLDEYNLKYNKIASPMLTYKPLLRHVARKGKKTFISTGMSIWENIDNAVDIFTRKECPYVLMHCVGLYPCPINKLNLNVITELKKKYYYEKRIYSAEIGYSSHSPGVLDTSLAVLLGAKYIEVHITLDRAMWGSDQAASLEKKGLELTVKNARLIDDFLGSGKKELVNEELKIARKLRYWEK